jgi:molybdopterin-synthase adenylyltransferase
MLIAFCGVGALGSTAAVLCRNLDATLRLIDFDRVESKNLLAQAFVKQSIGKNKAEALKLQLQNFFGVKAEAFGVRLAENNCDALLKDAELIVDCFDNLASRKLVSEYARKHAKPLVHAALSGDGLYGIVRWDEQFVPDAEDREGQATCEGGDHLPLIGLLGATLARAIQDYATSGVRRDSMVSLNGVRETSS